MYVFLHVLLSYYIKFNISLIIPIYDCPIKSRLPVRIGPCQLSNETHVFVGIRAQAVVQLVADWP